MVALVPSAGNHLEIEWGDFVANAMGFAGITVRNRKAFVGIL